MESERFDSLTRTLSSRRATLTGLVGGLAALLGPGPEQAGAHNPLPACQKITDPARRRRCLRRARAHNRARHTCRPQPVAATCANRCGERRNNCGQEVDCACPAGKLCLANEGCGRWCDPVSLACPAGCTCGYRLTEDFAPHCVPSTITDCTQLPQQICTSTAQCPVGQFCALTPCGPNDTAQQRCVPVCPV